jgi:hypothetical protein
MHHVVALIAVALLFAGLIAPGVEAIAGCAQTCPDDDTERRCADDMCCSCCMYAPPATLSAEGSAAPAGLSSPTDAAIDAATLPGEGNDLLHVPKAIRS